MNITFNASTAMNQDKMQRTVGEIVKDYEIRRELVPVPAPMMMRPPPGTMRPITPGTSSSFLLPIDILITGLMGMRPPIPGMAPLYHPGGPPPGMMGMAPPGVVPGTMAPNPAFQYPGHGPIPHGAPMSPPGMMSIPPNQLPPPMNLHPGPSHHSPMMPPMYAPTGSFPPNMSSPNPHLPASNAAAPWSQPGNNPNSMYNQ